MPQNILVVEYEPKYAERLRQVLTREPFAPTFVKDGEEALRAILDHSWQLIVLSSVTPKVSAADLVREIRTRDTLQATPILLTVSGYKGSSPKADALRFGASDLLAKPYGDDDLLAKVNGLLGTSVAAPAARSGAGTGFEGPPDKPAEATLTSTDIFGDLLDDSAPQTVAPKRSSKPSEDLDKMLADTLSGVRQPQRKKDADKPPVPASTPPPPPPAAPSKSMERSSHAAPTTPATPSKSRTEVELDKLLTSTLSGLEKRPRTRAGEPLPPSSASEILSHGEVASGAPAATAPAPPLPPVVPPPVVTPTRAPAHPEAPRHDEKVTISAPILSPVPAAAREDEPDDSDGIRFGQYVLIEKIATGGMAEVWKARMRGVEGFQKIVAIKKILPHLSDDQEFVDMFIDEAKFAAQLNHNNIIHIYDLGKIAGSYYIAMEYVDGGDLKSIIRKGESAGQPLTVELSLFIASKIASALDYAHRKRDFDENEMGLVHRDVSPQNVLVSHDGDIKLCDFGIAKAASKASHTQTGALKGKLQYMSPEQAWGKPIDRRSDVFALGTVLYEMLTGGRLFGGDSEISILEQVREARVHPPSEVNDEVPPEVDRIVLKALQKDAGGRYQTAGEMAREIDTVLYSFRPTPTSADLAIHMHRIHSADPSPAPVPQFVNTVNEPTVIDEAELAPAGAAVRTAPMPPRPVAPPSPLPVVAVAAPTPVIEPQRAAPEASFLSVPEKKRSMVPVIIAVVLVAGLAGAYFMFRGNSRSSTTQPTSVVPAQPIANQPASAPGTVSATTTAVATPAASATDTAATSTAPVLDTAQVDAEVRRRIAAEKARLAQQAGQQSPAAPPAASRPAPVPVVTAPRSQPPAVPPQVTASNPPVQERPVVTASQPPPQPPPAAEHVAEAPPQITRAREGDLVAPGTEGLKQPHLINKAALAYPKAAKMEHVQGTVILSVLVSETGKVMDVKVIRGVNQGGGLNEAAIECMRRSTFAPATKDGVAVKSYVTVPIDFKL